ncbi:GNAT family N-acetyltransferase [uncultured Gemella sp.]|mgnify:CR=1 FL=1|uniref:GNAT family N-acetyltransferase n=1 Tax=uncultured Gemella sp. TaxID=254352 RepID=UPI002608EA91|nr:GNAT family N-acetyltransferase [uncultured Gemella sp.]
MKIIEEGRTFLREQGINQWQHGEPSREKIINDINEGISYVLEKSGEIVATAMLSSFDEDYEKSLTLWTTNSSYLAIHRISTASDLRNQGIAREIMEVIHILAKSQNINFLRIDTHLNNNIMRKFLSNFGFVEKK